MMACYLVKSYRIHKIFSNKKVKPIVLTDSRLLQYVGVMVLYEVVFLAIWTGVDTPIVVQQADRLSLDTDYLVCGGKTTIFPILSLFSKVAMMCWGIYLAWKTRRVIELFSESRYIGYSIYTIAFTSAIFVPLLYVLPEFQMLWLVLACTGIVVVFTVPPAIIFARLFRFIQKYPNDVSQEQIRNMTLNHRIMQDTIRKSRHTTTMSIQQMQQHSSTLSTGTGDRHDTGSSSTVTGSVVQVQDP